MKNTESLELTHTTPEKKRSLLKKGALVISVLSTLSVVSCTQERTKTSAQYPADNTGRNLRDANGEATVTPENQKESSEDLKITQKIRQAIMADDSLSMNAKNVKIVSTNGSVTLRGPVNDARERDVIENKAKQIAGDSKVDCQLEIKNQQGG